MVFVEFFNGSLEIFDFESLSFSGISDVLQWMDYLSCAQCVSVLLTAELL